MSVPPLPSRPPSDLPSTRLDFGGQDFASILLNLSADISSKITDPPPLPPSLSPSIHPSPPIIPHFPDPKDILVTPVHPVSDPHVSPQETQTQQPQPISIALDPLPHPLPPPKPLAIPLPLPTDEQVVHWCRNRRRDLGLSTAAVHSSAISKDSLGHPLMNDLGMLACCHCFSVGKPIACICACHSSASAGSAPPFPPPFAPKPKKKRAKMVESKEVKPKRQRKGNSVKCSYCGETGHNKVSCEKRKADPSYHAPDKQKYSCTRCGKPGHSKKKCPNDPLPEATPSKPNKYKCSICGERGHNARSHAVTST